MRTELCELATLYGTDKCNFHHYTEHYHEMFKDRRDKVRKVLEIGIGDSSMKDPSGKPYSPGASLRMWESYFPNALIMAIDNNRSVLINEGRIISNYADQGDLRSMHNVTTDWHCGAVPFDLIVDDGSHVPEHQVSSARLLLPLLAPGGIYVIEDVWPYPCEVGWSKEPFGLKLSDLNPYPAQLIQCGDNRNSDDHLVVIRR